jgi:hypothetical protein
VLSEGNTRRVVLPIRIFRFKSGHFVISNPDNQSKLFRGVSALLIVAICGCLVLPMPVMNPLASTRLSGKDSSVPFPCMLKPCGCRSAEECWRKCCCFTNSQKVVWAEERGIDLPEYVLQAAEEEAGDGVRGSQLAATAPGTADATPTSCETSLFASILSVFGIGSTSSAAVAGASCCETDRDSIATEDESRELSEIRLVSTVQALKCSGVDLAMAILSTLFNPDSQCLVRGSQLPAYLVSLQSEVLPEGSLQPPVPPPRLSGV